MANFLFFYSRPFAITKLGRTKEVTACANNKCAIFGIYMEVEKWEKGAKDMTNGTK